MNTKEEIQEILRSYSIKPNHPILNDLLKLIERKTSDLRKYDGEIMNDKQAKIDRLTDQNNQMKKCLSDTYNQITNAVIDLNTYGKVECRKRLHDALDGLNNFTENKNDEKC